MKHTLLYIALSAAIVGAPAALAQAEPASHSATSSQTLMTRDLAKLDTAMEKVDAQMVKIHAADEGEEQRDLIATHMDSMQENFETLQDLVGRNRASEVTTTTPAAPAGRTMRSPAATANASTAQATQNSDVSIDQQMVILERQLKQTQVRMESISENAGAQSNRHLGKDHLTNLQANVDTMQAVVDSFTQQHSSARATSPAGTPVTSTTPPQ